MNSSFDRVEEGKDEWLRIVPPLRKKKCTHCKEEKDAKPKTL